MAVKTWCVGHPKYEVLPDLIVHIAWAGAEFWGEKYSVCIECAEDLQRAIDKDWEDWRIDGLRQYWWADYDVWARSL